MNQYTITIAICLLRVIIGLRFIFPGWMMIQKGPLSAKGYLEHTEGVLAPIFKKLAENKFVDYLNKWGLFLIGLAMVFGIFVRFASYAGILMMIFYWLSKFPHKEGVIDDNILSIAVFILLIVVNAGIFFGFDYLILQVPTALTYYQAHTWLEWIL